ncbi:NAD(P)H-hydrate dehydratase [Hathewaya histolytica]|uniref:NAD(P)H-hydrate dehydratase n=1 Tax=Hathewaya histolytica TaxID=1498 RepID=UPI003B67096F
MRVGKAEHIRELDRYCIEELKIPSIVLMENAALKILKHIEQESFNDYVVLAGRGNNGGDALAVARHLISKDKKVKIFIIGDRDGQLDFKINYEILKNMNAEIVIINKAEDLDILKCSIKEKTLILDGIFGTGLKRNVEGLFKNVINVVNEYSKYTLSIDIPSGIHSDTGKVLGIAIKAQKTISFQVYKRGFFAYESIEYLGDIYVESIGIPRMVLDKMEEREFYLEKEFVKSNLSKRSLVAHKGDFGRALIFAGSKGFTGAALISTNSAVKSGAGLVTLACAEEIYNSVGSRLLEAMSIENNNEKIDEYIKKSDSIAIGPGMGNKPETLEIIKRVLKNRRCPMLIDADGLNVLTDNLNVLKENSNYPIILTPHLGEMSRLTSLSIEEIRENRFEVAKKFSRDYGVIVLLKGFNTVITNGEELYINSTGNSSMASGGMGDCLTGIITALIAQGYDAFKATALGAYIHGYVGDKLSNDKFVVTAEDIINNISKYIKELLD